MSYISTDNLGKRRVTDNFNIADTASPSIGPNWTTVLATGITGILLKVESQEVRYDSSSGSASWSIASPNDDLLTNSQSVRADAKNTLFNAEATRVAIMLLGSVIQTAAGGTPARFYAYKNGYVAVMAGKSLSRGNLHIYKVVNNVETLLGTVSGKGLEFNGTHPFRFDAIEVSGGHVLKAYVDDLDTPVIELFDNEGFTGKGHGIGFSQGNQNYNPFLDNYLAEDIGFVALPPNPPTIDFFTNPITPANEGNVNFGGTAIQNATVYWEITEG